MCVCVHSHASWCYVHGCKKVRKSGVFGGGFPFPRFPSEYREVVVWEEVARLDWRYKSETK